MIFDPDTMKVIVCRKCKGIGTFGVDVEGNRFTCTECGGTGRILIKTTKTDFPLGSIDENHSFDEETMKVHVCKTCRGLGVVNFGNGNEPCRNCDGAGRIVEQKIQQDYQMRVLDEFNEKGE